MTTTANKIEKRPPVVAILGHIDHGKSTLLDYIRKTNIVDKETGGITQHISAYEIEHEDKEHGKKKITFVDTPGHESFCNVRSRGAKVADIAILIVSAEDGVMSQTKEAIKCIKEDEIPFIVAITKTDSPKADIDKTKNSLVENEVYVEGHGGNIPVVPISAKTGDGIDELLSMIILIAELEEFTADNDCLARGTIVEAHKDNKKGITATLIIKNGKLEVGNFIAGNTAISPIRSIENTIGTKMKTAYSSTPVVISGWNEIPIIGSEFQTFSTKKEAEAYCAEYKKEDFNIQKKEQEKERDNEKEESEKFTVIPLIIKTDVSGTGEAIAYEVSKLNNDRVSFRILTNGTGNISEADMKTAATNANTVVVGMGVSIDSQAEVLKERDNITISTFKIIYELIEYLENLAKERRPKIMIDKVNGSAKVLAIFSKTKKTQVIGGKVKEGTIAIGNEIRIMRKNEEIGRGKIKELQQQKIKSDKVEEGNQFGASILTDIDIAENDHFEAIQQIES